VLPSASAEHSASLGSLLIASALLLKGSSRTSCTILFIPALLELATLAVAQTSFLHPSRLQAAATMKPHGLHDCLLAR
jgi:hypothetical protein